VYIVFEVTSESCEGLLLQASKEAVLRQIGEAECVHLATHMSWKLSAIVLSPGGDIVDSQHAKRFFSSSGGIAGQTPSVTGVPAASDQGDEEGSEVSACDDTCCNVCSSPATAQHFLLLWTKHF
jgi:hypothetical protein